MSDNETPRLVVEATMRVGGGSVKVTRESEPDEVASQAMADWFNDACAQIWDVLRPGFEGPSDD